MTDRELLELAAKAAGYIGFSGYDYKGPYFCIPSDPAIPRVEPQTFRWLTDDGDALRLAVRLEIDVDFSYGKCSVQCFEGVTAATLFEESFGNDPLAATRRAIVRAAAEIGRNMP